MIEELKSLQSTMAHHLITTQLKDKQNSKTTGAIHILNPRVVVTSEIVITAVHCMNLGLEICMLAGAKLTLGGIITSVSEAA